MTNNKYKVNELAKDFGKTTKEITELLSKFFEEPKKSQLALTLTSLKLQQKRRLMKLMN